jgi:hypothetical protein
MKQVWNFIIGLKCCCVSNKEEEEEEEESGHFNYIYWDKTKDWSSNSSRTNDASNRQLGSHKTLFVSVRKRN